MRDLETIGEASESPSPDEEYPALPPAFTTSLNNECYSSQTCRSQGKCYEINIKPSVSLTTKQIHPNFSGERDRSSIIEETILFCIGRPFREDKNHMNHQPDADSKENRLTCHPVGRPLSAVGLGNAESQPGANALLRDNDLLSRPRTSNHKKNQKQSPASPVCPASPDLRVGLPDNRPVSHPPSTPAD